MPVFASDFSNNDSDDVEVVSADENSESDEEVMGYSENNLQNLLNVLNKLRQESRERFQNISFNP